MSFFSTYKALNELDLVQGLGCLTCQLLRWLGAIAVEELHVTAALKGSRFYVGL